jgi:hypothetical protein
VWKAKDVLTKTALGDREVGSRFLSPSLSNLPEAYAPRSYSQPSRA